ncbi:MAG: endonuclease V [Streptosporangiaceae bacterium]|jgi:deoxyribonuclease V
MGRFAAVDVYYPSDGDARAALVLAKDATFSTVESTATASGPVAAEYQSGEFYRRELPALRPLLASITEIELLIVDGYVDLDPDGRPGLGAYVHDEFGMPVIGVAKSLFRTATHAIPVLRGTSNRPLFVTAAGVPLPDAAQLVLQMNGDYRIPEALRLVDALTRTPTVEPDEPAPLPRRRNEP